MCLIEYKGKQQLLSLSSVSALSYELCALSKCHKTATAPVSELLLLFLGFDLEKVETVIVYVSQFLFNFLGIAGFAL